MKNLNFLLRIEFLVYLTLLFGFKAAAQSHNDLDGIWIGTMEINENIQLSVGFEFSFNEASILEGLLHSIDQGAYDMPITSITVEDKQVTIFVNAIGLTYKGAFTDAETIEGNATQGNNAPWRLNIKKVDALPVSKPNRPQEPIKPYPYFEEHVTFKNEKAGVTLAGTLTKPKSGDSFPVVVLISGSGPTDRDATIFGHKFFLVLADKLTKAGYAVLRTDDRGVAESTGNFHTATVVNLAEDAVAAVAYLSTREDINKNQIGLIGHSLGAEKAAIAATISDDIAFVVLMAGGATPLYQGIYDQTVAYYSTQVSPEAVALNTKVLHATFETLKVEPDNVKAKEIINQKLTKLNDDVTKLPKEEQIFLNLVPPLSADKFNFFMSPTMRFDLFFDPTEVLEKIKIPVLAINGTLDLQVLPHNLELIEKALHKGGNTNYSIHMFENKNHMLQDATDGTPEEYTEIENTIAPDVLDCIINWMDKLTKN